MLSIGVEMEYSGNLLLGNAVLLSSIDTLRAGIYGQQQIMRVEAPEGLLRDFE